MTATSEPSAVPFTAEDYAARMARAAGDAQVAGLDGILVGPGPDLAWLTGYRPPASTERLTTLVLRPDANPKLVVPTLERPDAAEAGGAAGIELVDWTDGSDPYLVVAGLLSPQGRYGISDATWSMHLLGLQQALPQTAYRALSPSLPMLRAVKDTNELARLDKAGAAADKAYDEIVEVPFAGRRETEVAADLARLLREHGHEQIDFTVVGSGPNG
jgi:Xaa-Pro aminopeptidase